MKSDVIYYEEDEMKEEAEKETPTKKADNSDKVIDIKDLLEKKKKSRSMLWAMSQEIENLKNMLIECPEDQRVKLINDTLEGGDFDENVEFILQLFDKLEEVNKIRAAEIARIKKNKDRDARTAEILKESIAALLHSAGRMKAGGPIRSTSVQGGKVGYKVTDESLVPKKYYVKQPDKIDSAKLKVDAMSKKGVPGTEKTTGKPFLVNR